MLRSVFNPHLCSHGPQEDGFQPVANITFDASRGMLSDDVLPRFCTSKACPLSPQLTLPEVEEVCVCERCQ